MTTSESRIPIVDGRIVTINFSIRCGSEFAREWDHVMVVGDIPELSNWLPDGALPLQRQTHDRDIWEGKIQVPNYKQVQYRYFVCQYLDDAIQKPDHKSTMVISRWETQRLPRTLIPALSLKEETNSVQLVETFGVYGGRELSDLGWLIYQSEVRLRVPPLSLEFWKQRHKNRVYSIRVTPLDLRFKEMDSLDISSSHIDADSQDGMTQPLLPSHTQCEISVLNEEGEYNFHDQSPTGRLYNPQKDYFVFKTQSVAVDYLAFLIDFYTPTRLLDNKSGMSSTQSSPHSSVSTVSGDSPLRPEDMTRVGFCYVLPSNLKDSWGQILVPITSIHLQPIGQIKVHYLVVTPLSSVSVPRFLMSTTYTRHWKKRKALNVGHRGMGNSYTKMSVVRENTIKSLQDAAEHGADYVEFDVQLSKDRVPIIYHDFHVGVTIFRRPDSSANNATRISKIDLSLEDDKMLNVHKMAVKDLKYKQLRLLKFTHETTASNDNGVLNSHATDSAGSPAPNNCNDVENIESDALYEKAQFSLSTPTSEKRASRRWDVTEESQMDDKDQLSQPFPRLDDVLQELHPHVGVNIEVKYPLMQLDGEHECQHFFERNEYLDIILADVLTHAGQRRVLFSSFDPDICTMLKLKQNKYPVFFLTMGSYTTRYVPLNDLRCQNTYISMNFAHSIKLMGVNLHAEDVLKEPQHLSMAEIRKLVIFVWGDDLDNKENLKFLRDKGVDGLIYDRIDENDTTMGQCPKRNIFAIEKALKDELFRARSRSPLTVDDSALESSKKSQSNFDIFLDPPKRKEF